MAYEETSRRERNGKPRSGSSTVVHRTRNVHPEMYKELVQMNEKKAGNPVGQKLQQGTLQKKKCFKRSSSHFSSGNSE